MYLNVATTAVTLPPFFAFEGRVHTIDKGIQHFIPTVQQLSQSVFSWQF